MKTVILFLLSVCLYTEATSQVKISLQLPPQGIVTRSQLWNMLLINSDNSDLTIQVNLSLKDLSSGEEILSASTSMFVLPKGSMLLSPNDFLNINYTVFNTSYSTVLTAQTFLPIGNFTACYQVIKLNEDAYDLYGEECQEIGVEPLSPPILNLPENEDSIDYPLPIFSWLPPSPVNLFQNLTYDFNLVELFDNQSPIDAITDNYPLLLKQGITESQLQYSPVFPKLTPGKRYVWQVTANNNSLKVAKTEIWSLNIKPEAKPSGSFTPSTYIKLQQKENIPFTVSAGSLKFEYLNEINDTAISFSIVNLSANAATINGFASVVESVRLGQNFMEIVLDDQHFRRGNIYLLELTNSKNEKWAVKFMTK